MKPPRAALGAILLSITACGGGASPAADDDPDAATAAREVSYDDLYGELAAVYCGRVFACCADDERRLIGIIPYVDERPEIPDEAACTAYITEHLQVQERLAALEAVAADGTLEYDPARAGACLDEYAALSCDVFGHEFWDVRNMTLCSPFVANQADGDACEYDEQCPTGYCSDTYVCAAKPGSGDACPVSVCADGLYCDVFGDGTCKAPKGDGADCVFHEECTSGYCGYENSKGDTGFCGVAETWVCDGP
jgi:hypothetical protein